MTIPLAAAWAKASWWIGHGRLIDDGRYEFKALLGVSSVKQSNSATTALSLLATGLIALGVNCGCQPDDGSSSPIAEQLRSSVLTVDMPASASTLEQLLEQDALDEVTLVGRIYGGKLEPFDPENASFTVTILPEVGHSHDDPNDCPFCKRRAEDAPMAVVEIRGDDGKLIAERADQLLGLAKNQDVVVQGNATKLNQMIVIAATKISKVPSLQAAHDLVIETDSSDEGESGIPSTGSAEPKLGTEPEDSQ